MGRQAISVGGSANDGTGDPLRTAFQKINSNFVELYSAGIGYPSWLPVIRADDGTRLVPSVLIDTERDRYWLNGIEVSQSDALENVGSGRPTLKDAPAGLSSSMGICICADIRPNNYYTFDNAPSGTVFSASVAGANVVTISVNTSGSTAPGGVIAGTAFATANGAFNSFTAGNFGITGFSTGPSRGLGINRLTVSVPPAGGKVLRLWDMNIIRNDNADVTAYVPQTNFRIGDVHAGNATLTNCTVEQIVIFSRALSASEMYRLNAWNEYQRPVGMFIGDSLNNSSQPMEVLRVHLANAGMTYVPMFSNGLGGRGVSFFRDFIDRWLTTYDHMRDWMLVLNEGGLDYASASFSRSVIPSSVTSTTWTLWLTAQRDKNVNITNSGPASLEYIVVADAAVPPDAGTSGTVLTLSATANDVAVVAGGGIYVRKVSSGDVNSAIVVNDIPYTELSIMRDLDAMFSMFREPLKVIVEPHTNQAYITEMTNTAMSATRSAGTACATATVANPLSLSGIQNIASVFGADGQRVLVKNASNQRDCGVYIMSAGPWTRATDADTVAELTSQSFTVSGGTNAGKTYFFQPFDAVGTEAIIASELLPVMTSTWQLVRAAAAINVVLANDGPTAVEWRLASSTPAGGDNGQWLYPGSKATITLASQSLYVRTGRSGDTSIVRVVTDSNALVDKLANTLANIKATYPSFYCATNALMQTAAATSGEYDRHRANGTTPVTLQLDSIHIDFAEDTNASGAVSDAEARTSGYYWWSKAIMNHLAPLGWRPKS